ncbi:MAG: amidohydrolase family protein [Actinomycetota bacterium]
MLDLILRGGHVADGTGAEGAVGDVGIRDGKIAAVGKVDEDAAEVVDVDGLVVAPGFVDIHTHYDAQAFWDTTLSPSPLHGVTTVVGGNCGFTIAPLVPDAGEYLKTMLARVEGMPLESLDQGVPWDWTSFAEYLDRLDGRLSVNAGFLVGHSAIRRVVMGEDATSGRAPTADERERMLGLLREGLAAGGMGFSSTWSPTHNDAAGDPVPSRHADADELVAFCEVVKEFAGTTLEFLPTSGDFEEEHYDVMTRMSVAADRPLNWNVLQVTARNGAMVDNRLAAGDYAAERGGKVIALTIPDVIRPRLCFQTGFVLDALPGWAKPMALPDDEKLRLLADPERRAELNELAQSETGPLRGVARWEGMTLVECFTDETRRFEGGTVGDAATEMGLSPWDALCQIAVLDELRTGFSPPARGDSDDDWARRVEVWRDPRAIVGASDAGAHLDLLATFNYSTTLLAETVRKRPLLSVDEAVRMLTDDQARLYGITGRGRLAPGWAADIVVFDPATIGPGPVHTRDDLPGGAGRLYGEAEGIERVYVNGTQIVRGREMTEARPGTLLRSGRDTETVTAS